MRLGQVMAAVLAVGSLGAGSAVGQIPTAAPPADALRLNSVFHGTFIVDLDRQGELIACDDSEGVVFRNVFVFDYLAGVCDDQGEVPCNERVTSIVERCTLAPLDDFGGQAGILRGTYRRGVASASRMCFDELGACTALDEIAVVTGRTQSVGTEGGLVGTVRSVSEVRSTRAFEIDGRTVRVLSGTVYTDGSFEEPKGTFPDNCLFNGCGMAGVGIAVD